MRCLESSGGEMVLLFLELGNVLKSGMGSHIRNVNKDVWGRGCAQTIKICFVELCATDVKSSRGG